MRRSARTVYSFVLILFFFSLFVSPLIAMPTVETLEEVTVGKTLESDKGLVVSVEKNASMVGAQVLKNGGNAIDAAVAVAFALAVTWPPAGNIGGGGFMVIAKSDGEQDAIDYREMAPRGATADMFLDEEGQVEPVRVRLGHWPVGVPGTVRGMAMAHSLHGTRPWEELVRPAVKLAREGFIVSEALAGAFARHQKELRRFPSTREVYFDGDGKPWGAGHLLVQSDLARTMEAIAEQGPAGFYEGDVARLIAMDMETYGGLITEEDLKGYKAVRRKPLQTTFKGHEVLSMPPPSSGGVALFQVLGMLEDEDLASIGAETPLFYHLTGEALRRAFADRAKYLGDADFADVPIAKLLSKEHIDALGASIHRSKASSSADFGPPLQQPEGSHTTHFSVIDQNGNAVSNTYTLEESFGAKVIAKGTGVLLNNEMHDFNVRPGETSQRGRIGTKPNRIEPGKRPLSSMTPTIVLKRGKPVLICGSPGGRTIISTVTQMVLRVIGCGVDLEQASTFGRIHHQWYPDALSVESRISDDVRAKLEAFGHQLKTRSAQGDAHAIWVDSTTGRRIGVADRRISGWAAGH